MGFLPWIRFALLLLPVSIAGTPGQSGQLPQLANVHAPVDPSHQRLLDAAGKTFTRGRSIIFQQQNQNLMTASTLRKKAGPLQHDRMIVANELHSVLFSWRDRLVVLAVVIAAVVAINSALSNRPFIFAATAVAALATVTGAATARMIERRLDFHAQDGVLAADALAPDARRHYALPIHALVCAIVTVCAVIGRPTAAVFAPVAYLIGAGISHVVCRVVLADASPRRSLSIRGIGRQLQRPIAGALAATVAILPMLLVRSIEPGQMATIIGLLGAVIALLLTTVDYGVVRFMTESGYSAARIIGIHARSLLVFLVLTVLGSLILSDTLVVIVVCGVVLAALIFMTSRIFAYRVHSKRTADTLVGICGIVCMSGVAMPLFLPVLVIAILWQLYRRAAPVTWLLK